LPHRRQANPKIGGKADVSSLYECLVGKRENEKTRKREVAVAFSRFHVFAVGPVFPLYDCICHNLIS